MTTDDLITVYLPNGRTGFMPLEDFNETDLTNFGAERGMQ